MPPRPPCAVELRNALEKRAGIELPSTLVFDYPTVAALAAFLASKVAASQAADGSAGAGAGSDAGSDGWLSDEGSLGSMELALLDAAPQLRLVGASEVAARSSGDALLRPQPSDQSRPIPVERWDVEAQAELVGGLPVQVRARGGTGGGPQVAAVACRSTSGRCAVACSAPAQRKIACPPPLAPSTVWCLPGGCLPL